MTGARETCGTCGGKLPAGHESPLCPLCWGAVDGSAPRPAHETPEPLLEEGRRVARERRRGCLVVAVPALLIYLVLIVLAGLEIIKFETLLLVFSVILGVCWAIVAHPWSRPHSDALASASRNDRIRRPRVRGWTSGYRAARRIVSWAKHGPRLPRRRWW